MSALRISIFIPMILMVCFIAVPSESKRLPKTKHEPAAAIGYQLEKSGPTLSFNSKDNSVMDDDDEKDRKAMRKDRQRSKAKAKSAKSKVTQDQEDEELLDELERNHHRPLEHPNDVTTSDDIDLEENWAFHDDLEVEDDLDGPDLPDQPFDMYRSQQELIGMVMALTERVQSLQHTMTNIKLQNHYIYRTMKKNYKKCKESSSPGSQRDLTIHSAAQKMDKIQCPKGFTENTNTNTCYKFMVERISWRMARERCRMDDSDLVTIETKGEQRWITQQARQSQDTRHCDFWTGASDRKSEGDWRWIANNNALSYSNWNVNEPNNGRTGEHCAQMLWVFNWAWNDAHCDYHNACYICETTKTRGLN